MNSTNSSPDYFYSRFLEQIKASVKTGSTEFNARSLLDGAAADAVHEWVPRTIRTLDGIFFSGHALAEAAASLITDDIKSGARIFDPACGGGDLLIAAARQLPLGDTFSHTLENWSDRLGGTDIHQSFVETTKWRLALLAKSRHGIESEILESLNENIFPHIKKADYLSDAKVSDEFDCIIVNPPFGHRIAPSNCRWSSGKTQLAAIFLDAIIRHRKVGQRVVAILPDVLRGGSRYTKWRDEMATMAIPQDSKVYGRFEKRTDVDVFIIKYEATQKCTTPVTVDTSSTDGLKSSTNKVGDAFSVSVGAVVPHRHPDNKGSWRPYLTVRNALIDFEVTVNEYRRFDGRCFQPPFVAIRRTSNPSDARRIGCTIVTGAEEIAVENHLIIVTPLTGSIEDCRRLVEHLKSEITTNHINGQLRCRHLTTGSIKSLPI